MNTGRKSVAWKKYRAAVTAAEKKYREDRFKARQECEEARRLAWEEYSKNFAWAHKDADGSDGGRME